MHNVSTSQVYPQSQTRPHIQNQVTNADQGCLIHSDTQQSHQIIAIPALKNNEEDTKGSKTINQTICYLLIAGHLQRKTKMAGRFQEGTEWQDRWEDCGTKGDQQLTKNERDNEQKNNK